MGLDMSKNRVTVGFFNGLLDVLRESALSITQLDMSHMSFVNGRKPRWSKLRDLPGLRYLDLSGTRIDMPWFHMIMNLNEDLRGLRKGDLFTPNAPTVLNVKALCDTPLVTQRAANFGRDSPWFGVDSKTELYRRSALCALSARASSCCSRKYVLLPFLNRHDYLDHNHHPAHCSILSTLIMEGGEFRSDRCVR